MEEEGKVNFFKIIDENEHVQEVIHQKGAVQSAHNQQEDGINLYALVVSCMCCTKRTNCLIWKHSPQDATAIVTE
jgi:hypothetical protein